MRTYLAKRFALIVLGVLFSICMYSQYYEGAEPERENLFSHYDMVHEVSAWGGVAYTPFRIDRDMGEKTGLTKPSAGLGYTFWIIRQIGIGTGLEYASYGSKIKLNDYTESVNTRNQNFYAKVNTFEEKVTAEYLNIPLMANFQTRGESVKYHMAAGVKFGIPLKGRSSINTVSADYRFSVPNDIPRTETGHYDNDMYDKSKIDFKSTMMLAAELGAKWKLNENIFLYTSVYADYGLNNIRRTVYPSRTDLLISYDQTRTGNKINTSSLLFSHHVSDAGKDDLFVDRIRPISIGVKVKLSFEMSVSRKTRNTPLRKYLRGKYQDESYSPSVDKRTKASNTVAPSSEGGQVSEAFTGRFGF